VLNPNIPIAQVLKHCAGVARLGISIDEVLHESLIERSFGDDRDQVSFDQFLLLMLNTAGLANDETSALSTRPIAPGTGALAGHVIMGCSTLEHALGAMRQLYRATAIGYGVTVEGDDALLVVHGDEALSGPLTPMLEELFTICLFIMVCYFVGRAIPVRAHQTRDPLHAYLHRQHWGTFAPVRLASLAGLRVPRSLLAARRAGQSSDHFCWDLLQPWLAQNEGYAALADARLVNVENLRVEVLAAEAGVSPSTLRRHMTRTQGGFRLVRQKVVVDASLRLLRGSSRSTEAIAEELGYADARSFRRFIKSATGKTPEALRADRSAAAPSATLVRERIKAVASGTRAA
jgi:AraC-like DNA-binding protein